MGQSPSQVLTEPGKYLTLVLGRASFESWLHHLAVGTSVSLCVPGCCGECERETPGWIIAGQADGPGSFASPLATFADAVTLSKLLNFWVSLRFLIYKVSKVINPQGCCGTGGTNAC